jgi:hypothetical protein
MFGAMYLLLLSMYFPGIAPTLSQVRTTDDNNERIADNGYIRVTD